MKDKRSLKSETHEVYPRARSRTDYDVKKTLDALENIDGLTYLEMYEKDLINLKMTQVKKYFDANPDVYQKYLDGCQEEYGMVQTKQYSKPYLAKRKAEMSKFIEDQKEKKDGV